MAEESKPIKVEILGERYSLKGDADPRYVKRLAEYVDGKMREISKHTKMPSFGKIAMLASLDIADELHQEREKNERLLSELQKKHVELTEILNEKLQHE